MKTPDESKKGLYSIDETKEILVIRTGIIHDRDKLYRSALAYIQQLERERDALLKYITDSHWAACDICKHDIDGSGTEGCKHIREIGIPCFEWRGVKEE